MLFFYTNIQDSPVRPRALPSNGDQAGREVLPMHTHSVVVAGRKPPLLRSLKRLLEPEFEVAAMTDNVISLLDALEQIKPDLLVMDTSSPEFGATNLAKRLELKHPDLRILLVAADDTHDPATGSHTTWIDRHNADESLLPAARGLFAGNGRSGTAGA